MRIHPGRTLASALYAVVFLLCLLPMLEVVLTAWPLQPSELPWRVGFLGLFSRALPLPLLAMTLALFAAALLGHLRLLRAFSALCLAVAVVLLAFSALLVLDALQMRGVVRPEVKLIYDVTAIRAMATLAVIGLVFLWLGAGGWLAGRRAASARVEPAAPNGLLAGSIGTPDFAEARRSVPAGGAQAQSSLS